MGIVLFENKSDCCACGACLNVCSKSAISMKPDAEGFLYPEIDPNKCIGCGLCTTKCEFDAIHLYREHPECSKMIKAEDKMKGILPYMLKREFKIRFGKRES